MNKKVVATVEIEDAEHCKYRCNFQFYDQERYGWVCILSGKQEVVKFKDIKNGRPIDLCRTEYCKENEVRP